MEIATFPSKSLVFVPDSDHSFLPARVVSTFKQGESAQVRLLTGENNLEEESILELNPSVSLQCQQMDEQSLARLDNMVEFRILNEASLMHNLRLRFLQNEIYTSIGDILVSVNPFKMMEDLYTPDTLNCYIKLGGGGSKNLLEPHVFSVADRAVRRMMEDHVPQSCIVSGESGAGKTEATKVFLQYLAEISQRNAISNKSFAGSQDNLQDRILQANPLLEAFGNAKTKRNDNSSRFGKFIQIHFEHGVVTSGEMTSYLLEKSRVVFVSEGERNYHIFYQLCAGAGVDKMLRTKYKVSIAPTDYYYLNQSTCVTVEEISDGRGWQQTLRAMESIGILDKEQKEVFITLAGILHLGNVQLTGSGNVAVVSEQSSLDALSYAAQCLGFPEENLQRAILKRDVSVRGEAIFKDLTLVQAANQRDTLAKHVYSLLFDWLLIKVNKSLETKTVSPTPKNAKDDVIGILDIFGFESFQRNSLEQLCINYCNEKLQGHFNSFVFTLEQTQYREEGLDVSEIAFKDNSSTVSLLEDKKRGLLSLIDEEMTVPNGSDTGFLKKVFDLKNEFISKPDMNLVRLHPKEYTNVFILTHFAGPVQYSVDSFLEKNKDELAPELVRLLDNTQREFILDLMPADDSSTKATTTGGAKKKPASLGFKFKKQLETLMVQLEQTSPHFVRCIKPNFEKVPDVFSAPMVLSQLRYSGLLEVCRIRQQGYPVQRTFAEFQSRYRALVPASVDLKSMIDVLSLKKVLPANRSWQMGKTKLFLRNDVLSSLEKARDVSLFGHARDLQRMARGFVSRKQLKRYFSILLQVEKAQTDEVALEAAILNCGNLPYHGVHLKQVQAAHVTLARLKLVSKTKRMLSDALKTRDQTILLASIACAAEVGIDANEPFYVQAREMVRFIEKKKEREDQLRLAISHRNAQEIQHELELIKLMPVWEDFPPIDLNEATLMLEKLLFIEKLAKDVVEMIRQQGEGKKVLELVSWLIEAGASKDHPAVLAGESYAQELAIVSAAHAKRVEELKRHLLREMNLTTLVALEMEAIQLGVDKDADLQSVWERKQVLEMHVQAETTLALAGSALQSKSLEQLTEEDIVSFERVMDTVTWTDVATFRAMAVLSRKQLQARTQLEKALAGGSADRSNKEELKAALEMAQSLGIQSETSRKVQALVTLQSIVVEEKKEMRRRSMMPPPTTMTDFASRLKADPTSLSMLAEDESEEGGDGDMIKSLPSVAVRSTVAKTPAIRRQSNMALDVTKPLTPEEKFSQREKRMQALLDEAKNWEKILVESALDAFRFDKCANIRLDEDFTSLELVLSKKQLMAQNKCLHQSSPLSKSILVLDREELNHDACSVFKSILGWAGDSAAQFPQTLARSVLKSGLESPALRDEIFAQLLKQLTKNPSGESIDRLYLLLCLCCETFLPSKSFLPCVVNFLQRQLRVDDNDHLLLGNYASWCLFHLSAGLKLGNALSPPTVKDITLYTTRPPVLLKIHSVYRMEGEVMSGLLVPVWPDQDVGNVERMICRVQQIPSSVSLVSGLFLKDLEKPRKPLPRMAIPNTPPPSSMKSTASPKTGKSLLSTLLRQASSGSGLISPQEPAAASPLQKSKSFRFSLSSSTEGTSRRDSVSSQRSEKPERKKLISAKSSLRLFARRNSEVEAPPPEEIFPKKLTSTKSSFQLFSKHKPAGGDNVRQQEEDDNSFVAVAGASSAVTSSANGNDIDQSENKTGGQQLSRTPPPPFAPWPLPHSFFLGDVFLRLVSQDRLPFLTYQKKLFLFDTEFNQATFVQISQDFINNRLPIAQFWEVLELACIATIRNAMIKKTPLQNNAKVDELQRAGFFNFIPRTWLGSTTYDWAGIALTYLKEEGLPLLLFKENELFERFLSICQNQPLFGASLFSVIHKNLEENLVACLNAQGLHVLTNANVPVCLGVIGFQEMLKFGASSTFIWIDVSDQVSERIPQLFLMEEVKTTLHLHTQQAREIYQLLTDYSFWFHQGYVREMTVA